MNYNLRNLYEIKLNIMNIYHYNHELKIFITSIYHIHSRIKSYLNHDYEIYNKQIFIFFEFVNSQYQ